MFETNCRPTVRASDADSCVSPWTILKFVLNCLLYCDAANFDQESCSCPRNAAGPVSGPAKPSDAVLQLTASTPAMPRALRRTRDRRRRDRRGDCRQRARARCSFHYFILWMPACFVVRTVRRRSAAGVITQRCVCHVNGPGPPHPCRRRASDKSVRAAQLRASTQPAVSRNWRKRVALPSRNVQTWTNGTSSSLPGSLRAAAVAPEHDHLVAGVEELVRIGAELVPPLLVQRLEDRARDLGEAAVEAAVRQALRLVPLDLRVHVGDARRPGRRGRTPRTSGGRWRRCVIGLAHAEPTSVFLPRGSELEDREAGAFDVAARA